MAREFKLCIITPSFSGGGAEKIAVSLANYYKSRRINVSLIVFRNAGPYKSHINPDIKLIDLKVRRERNAFFKMCYVLWREQPTHILSVIRLSNIFLGLYSFFDSKCKIIFREANTLHGLSSMGLLKKLFFLGLMQVSYRRSNLIIANSCDTKDDLILRNIAKESKISVCHNPVLPTNIDDLLEPSPSHRWLSDHKYKVILNVGRLHKQKNQDLLIRAFSFIYKDNSNVRLLIIGEGEEKTSLLKLIDELGLNDVVDIVGFQNNPYPYYKHSDVFVLTSQWEGFGNVIVEALASGTPVVSTDCPGGPKEILDYGKYGVLVSPDSLEDLAEAISKILNKEVVFNPKKLIQYSRSFSVSSVGNKYLELIKSS